MIWEGNKYFSQVLLDFTEIINATYISEII